MLNSPCSALPLNLFFAFMIRTQDTEFWCGSTQGLAVAFSFTHGLEWAPISRPKDEFELPLIERSFQ